MNKSAYRTTTPFDGGLSPETPKSGIVPLFGDTPLIQDILRGNPNGGRDYRLNGGGDWSSGETDNKSFRDRPEDYKIQTQIADMLKRNPARLKDEQWIGLDFEGKRHRFPSYEALQRRIRKGDIVFRSVSKVAQKTDNFITRALNACVMVESVSPGGQTKEIGSAFSIGNGLLLTCAHVIRRYDKMNRPASFGGELVKITISQRNKRAAAVFVTADLLLDLAVIRSDMPLSSLELGDTNPVVGTEVFAVGSPNGFENNLTEGVVSSNNRQVFFYPEAPTYLFTDAQVLPGSSGGPLISYDEEEVVGMISLIVGGQGLYGLNAALPSNTIRKFLREQRML